MKAKKAKIKAPEGEITASSYAEHAAAYCQRSGRGDGQHPVIRAGSGPWYEWLAYFAHIGHAHGRTGSFARECGKLTVPCLDPNDFDGGWRAREKAK